MAHSKFPGLEGKRVLIAGGSTGIGAAAAQIFSASGAAVCITGRNEARCRKAVDSLPSKGVYSSGDLTKPEDCARAVREAVSLLGGLDVLVNIGGGGGEELGPGLDAYAAVFNTNVISACALMEAAEEHLLKAPGVFINTSTILSDIPFPATATYSVAKAGLDMLTKCWALKYAKQGLRVNAVQPGPIRTAAMEAVSSQVGLSVEDWVRTTGSATPAGHVGAPEQAAAAYAFLASDMAGYITGVVLPVDGGAKLGYWFNQQHMGAF